MALSDHTQAGKKVGIEIFWDVKLRHWLIISDVSKYHCAYIFMNSHSKRSES